MSFGRIWDGRKDADRQESFEYGISNIFLRMGIAVGIILILKYVIG